MKILLISGQFAPFQLEVAAAANKLGVDYRVLFDVHQNKRGAHWLNCDAELKKYGVLASEEDDHGWTDRQLNSFKPDVILVGGVRGPRPAAAFRYRKRHPEAKVGFWLEPPNPQPNFILHALRTIDYHFRLKRTDFVFAIGPRTTKLYRKSQRKTWLIPYGEDLTQCFLAKSSSSERRTIRFLFSGGLERRHNFPQILEAFEQLLVARGPCFEFVISGSGEMQSVVDEALTRNPQLSSLVHFDRDFVAWDDRLRPFKEADVFVYPTSYAGWGLVIPEAMAAGALVITTQDAEAAHYFIEDGVNGLIVDTTVDDIVRSFLKCVDDPQWLYSAQQSARKSAARGDASYIANLLVSALREIDMKQ